MPPTACLQLLASNCLPPTACLQLLASNCLPPTANCKWPLTSMPLSAWIIGLCSSLALFKRQSACLYHLNVRALNNACPVKCSEISVKKFFEEPYSSKKLNIKNFEIKARILKSLMEEEISSGTKWGVGWTSTPPTL